MQARAVAARRLRKELANAPAATQTQFATAKPGLSHPERRLARVRKQLDLLDGHMTRLLSPPPGEDGKPAPIDEQAIERTARASAALSELERTLDGRPLPGSRRPKEEKPKTPTFPEPS
jgi:hypothetical protein